MAWQNDEAKRRRDSEVYNAEFRKNAAIVKRRANGRCEKCGRRSARIEADHIVPVSVTGTPDHSLGNLMAICKPCHAIKSAAEGHDARRRQTKRPTPRPRTQW